MIKSIKMNGTCATAVYVEVIDGIIKSVTFNGGCDGNLKAISKLVAGMHADDVIKMLEGIKCGHKDTSCPDQLAHALKVSEHIN